MNPTYITAAIAVAGLIANATWTVCNIRMENRILRRLNGLVTEQECQARRCRIMELLQEHPGTLPA